MSRISIDTVSISSDESLPPLQEVPDIQQPTWCTECEWNQFLCKRCASAWWKRIFGF